MTESNRHACFHIKAKTECSQKKRSGQFGAYRNAATICEYQSKLNLLTQIRSMAQFYYAVIKNNEVYERGLTKSVRLIYEPQSSSFNYESSLLFHGSLKRDHNQWYL